MQLIEKDGKTYILVGDKALLVRYFDEDDAPVIAVEAREIKHADGHQDVVVKVPFLRLTAESKGEQ